MLLSCLRCPAKSLLSDRDVCTMVNTCFRVLSQPALQNDVLQRAACHTLLDMIREIFAQLPGLPDVDEELPQEESTEGTLTPMGGTTPSEGMVREAPRH